MKKLIKLVFNRLEQAIELQTNSELSHAKCLLAIQAVIDIDLLDLPFQRLNPVLPETLAAGSNQQRNKLHMQKKSTRSETWMRTEYRHGGGHIPYHRTGVQDPTKVPIILHS